MTLYFIALTVEIIAVIITAVCVHNYNKSWDNWEGYPDEDENDN